MPKAIGTHKKLKGQKSLLPFSGTFTKKKQLIKAKVDVNVDSVPVSGVGASQTFLQLLGSV